MRYILTGDDKTVQNVLKENRIRIKRGLLSITPLGESDDESTDNGNDDGAGMDTKDIDTSVIDTPSSLALAEYSGNYSQ